MAQSLAAWDFTSRAPAHTMIPSMKRSRKIWLVALYAVNAAIAFLWLFAYGGRYSFRLAGVYFTPGVLAITVMVLVDVLLFFLLSRRSQ